MGKTLESKVVEILLGYLGGKVREMVNEQASTIVAPVARQLRRISLGVVLILASTGIWIVVSGCLLVSVFFALSPYRELTIPALETAGIGIVLGAILLAIGSYLAMYRKKVA